MQDLPKVAVVILNWNGKKWLSQFLPYVVASTYPNLEIWMVDNGSTDDSILFTKTNFPTIRVLPLGENHGFTQGNNLAILHLDSKYVILLNSDVEVSPNWIEPLVIVAEQNSNVAAIQPKILAYHQRDSFEYAGGAGGYIDSLGYPFCRGRIFDTVEKDQSQYESPQEIFWASGAACLIRKKVIDEIGLFEPSFFAHMEEIDFCWRAKNQGYQIFYEPKSTVWHVGGGTLPKSNPRKLYLNIRNSLSVLYRNLPATQLFFKIFSRLILDGIFGITLLLKKEFRSFFVIFEAHWAFFALIPKWQKFRNQAYPNQSPAFPSTGTYKGSVVWASFIKGVKYFGDLKN